MEHGLGNFATEGNTSPPESSAALPIARSFEKSDQPGDKDGHSNQNQNPSACYGHYIGINVPSGSPHTSQNSGVDLDRDSRLDARSLPAGNPGDYYFRAGPGRGTVELDNVQSSGTFSRGGDYRNRPAALRKNKVDRGERPGTFRTLLGLGTQFGFNSGAGTPYQSGAQGAHTTTYGNQYPHGGPRVASPQSCYARNQADVNERLRSMEAEEARLSQLLAQAEAELERAQIENSVILESRENLLRSMENSQLFLTPQEDDATISNSFRMLYQRVRTWSRSFVDERQVGLVPYATMKPKHQHLVLSALSRQSDRNFEADKKIQHRVRVSKRRRFFVEGIVGAFIYHNLVRAVDYESMATPLGCDYWTNDRLARAIEGLELPLTHAAHVLNLISAKEINDWRAYTVSLVSRVTGTDEAAERTTQYLQEETRELISLLACLAKEQCDPRVLEANLLGIFEQAVKFSKCLRSQRALFRVKYPGHAERLDDSVARIWFDRATMEDTMEEGEDDEEEDPDKPKLRQVNMFVFPGLFKSGNTAGERYDVEECLVRSLVHCAENIQAQRPSSTSGSGLSGHSGS